MRASLAVRGLLALACFAGTVGAAASASAQACQQRRWLARGGACTTVTPAGGTGDWTADPLFGIAPPPSLAPYCLYQWTPATSPLPTPADVTDLAAALAGQPGFTSLSEDCTLVTPQSGEPDVALWLHDAFLAREGLTQTGLSFPPFSPVKVLVLDTAPDSYSWISASPFPHGPVLANLIDEMTSFAGLRAGTVLALPRVENGLYSGAGGHFGFLSDLARAIYRALQLRAADDPARHLILNLSLGWEGCLSPGGCPPGRPPQVDAAAVYDALTLATCSDALVIAAAGNDSGGPSPQTGLLHPAIWHSELVSCEGERRALLHAAGGVDFKDQPIVLSRPSGRPPLSALATFGHPGGTPSLSTQAVYAGTSVSAATMSAVAAAAWALLPAYDPDPVMSFLHQEAVPLGAVADSCSPALGDCGAKRVSLCGVIFALVPGALPCPPAFQSLPPNALPAADPPAAAWLQSQILTAAATAPQQLSGALIAGLPQALLPRYLALAATANGSVFPQPIYPICPACVVAMDPYAANSQPFLYGTPAPLAAPTLVVESAGQLHAAPLPPLTASLRARYSFTLGVPFSQVLRAWITGFDTAGSSVTQQLVVAH